MAKKYRIATAQDLAIVIEALGALVKQGGFHTVTITTARKKRTLSQNNAMHLYFDRLAARLAEAGFTQRTMWQDFKGGFDLDVTAEWVKDLFKTVCKAKTGKDSTSELSTVEVNQVYEAFDKAVAEITGVREDFPSLEPPVYEGVED